MKLWWPHTEALYAVILARKLTGEERWLKPMRTMGMVRKGKRLKAEGGMERAAGCVLRLASSWLCTSGCGRRSRHWSLATRRISWIMKGRKEVGAPESQQHEGKRSDDPPRIPPARQHVPQAQHHQSEIQQPQED